MIFHWNSPNDKFSRCFTSNDHIRCLPNDEKCDRPRLVYSEDLFCFCCKLFQKVSQKENQLINELFIYWIHLSFRLKEHEISNEHVTRIDLLSRLEKNKAIDEHVQLKRETTLERNISKNNLL